MGPVEEGAAVVYLRPETAQGIYVNFLNVQGPSRQKVPFGIAQIGKAFRNEISPGNFIFRMREFEQMEMQFFVHPKEDEKWFEFWRQERMKWYFQLGIRQEKLRFHQHGPQELAHYAKSAYDVQYEFPFGWQELEGIHNRTDFDLSRHSQATGKELSYFNEPTKERFIPYIIETSAGCDRTLLTVLIDGYYEEEVKGETRSVLRIAPHIAPFKAAIFPLVNRDGMPEVATKIYNELRKKFKIFYDDKGAVGRRYRRMDEVGTPFCITVDSQTLQDETVTIRDRDTMQQTRHKISELEGILQKKVEI
jgi:glycyl-tRNA synthetase